MDAFTVTVLILLTYGAGAATHWFLTRKQRRLLKYYQRKKRVLRWVAPIKGSMPDE